MKKSSIIALSLLVLFLAVLIINIVKLSMNQGLNGTQTQYVQGLEFEKHRDYQNAYYNFGKVPRKSPLWIAATYRQALSAAELNDIDVSIRRYHKFIRATNDKNIAPLGYYELGMLYMKKEQYKRAGQIFRSLIHKFPKSDFARASNYHLAVISAQKGKNEEANKFFVEYLKDAPDGKYASSCISSLNESPIQLSAKDKFYIGVSANKIGEYTRALVYLSEIPFRDSWFWLAKSYQLVSNKEKASETYLNGIKKHSSRVSEDELSEAVSGYIETSGLSQNDSYKKLLSTVKNTKTNALAEILYRQAENLNEKQKIKNYEIIYKSFPDSKRAPEAVWEVFWNAYKTNNYDKAVNLGQLYVNKYNKPTDTTPKILYWCGKTLEKREKNREAIMFYNKILKDYPDSYYALRASAKTGKSPGGWKTDPNDTIASEEQKINFLVKDNSVLSNLATVEDFDLIDSFRVQDPFVRSWVEREKKRIVYSVTLAKDAIKELDTRPDSSDSRWKLLYPIYYAKTINKYAKEQKLDPFLVLAIIREESTFDPSVKSSVGAVGLMQLMPQTASYICQKAVCSKTNFELTQIDDNVALGSAYLRYLLNKLGHNEMLAVAAYNGGPGSVESWHKNLNFDDYDEFVENIPYEETRNYVKRVFTSYWNYKRVYGHQN